MIALIIVFSLVVLFAFGMANHLAGNDEWKEKLRKIHRILGSRVTGFVIMALLLHTLVLVTGEYAEKTGVLTTTILIMTFIIGRQRSPRGSFFLLSGGRPGAIRPNGVVDLWYDKPHSKLTEWLASRTSGVKNWTYYLYAHDRDILVKYAWHYGFWHIPIVLLPASILLSATTFAYAPLLAPLGCLGSYFHHIAGVNGYRHREKGGRGVAERLTGFFIYGMFSVLNVLGGAYIQGGWAQNWITNLFN